MKTYYHTLGLMSGSSLDGLDIAYARFDISREGTDFSLDTWELLEADTLPFSLDWKYRLQELPKGTAFELAEAHAAFGRYMGELVNRFLAEKNISRKAVDLIASHGHTIFHEPEKGFTTQIGDGAALAAVTGCKVVSDFRSADIARGGQGAPLAPMADKMLLPGYDFYLNLGGIANITCNVNGRFIAFDICGANQILNALANRMRLPYDDGGKMAATGTMIPYLFKSQKALPFFQQPYPKSLSNQWVQENQVQKFLDNPHIEENLLHTACELIASLIGEAISTVTGKEGFSKESHQMLATGGGVFNDYLVTRIREYIRGKNVEIVVPDATVVGNKEALLMALMGVMRMEGVPNVLSSVTGAREDSVGGSVYV